MMNVPSCFNGVAPQKSGVRLLGRVLERLGNPATAVVFCRVFAEIRDCLGEGVVWFECRLFSSGSGVVAFPPWVRVFSLMSRHDVRADLVHLRIHGQRPACRIFVFYGWAASGRCLFPCR